VAALDQAAVVFPDDVTLLVAGPRDGRLVQWADVIAPPLSHSLPASPTIQQRIAGGADGVTAANQFETQVPPDGGTALLVPGDAALAWLCGDPRAQFDAAHWLPVMAAVSPGVLCCRIPVNALARGAGVRVAAAGPAGAELPALLAVDLLGLDVMPVFGIYDAASRERALASHAVDAVFLHGRNVPQRAVTLAAAGVPPLFCLGPPDEEGEVSHDPIVSDIPTLPEFALRLRGAALGGPLYTAWRAAAAAAQLEYALVLPQLTPAALVAAWRQAGVKVAATHELQAGTAAGIRTLAMPAASVSAAAVAADAAALLDLRRWLGSRFNWQPV
jgi:hypothetical protein